MQHVAPYYIKSETVVQFAIANTTISVKFSMGTKIFFKWNPYSKSVFLNNSVFIFLCALESEPRKIT
jgi:hypothetical protein